MHHKYVVHAANGKELIELTEVDTVISSAQDFLQLMMNLPADIIILHKENLAESFFDLRSGLAGELLQKVSNYSRQLALVGDFSVYNSKSLHDFIYESNKSNRVVFVATVEEAIKKLSN